MGVEIEKLGYKLGKKSESSKQSPINMLEHSIDPPNTSRKQHRDPPLEYVEACSQLFELSPPEKYELLTAALNSSEKIVIDLDLFDSTIKELLIDVIVSLYLGCEKLPEIEIECDSLKYSLKDEDKDLSKKWDAFKKAVNEIANIMKNRALELHNKNPGS
jgi:hypothetical protein